MSVYGLRVRDANGAITLDVDDKINRVRLAQEAEATESDSVALPDIDGLLTVAMSFAINITAPQQTSHKVTRSGNTISWEPYTWTPDPWGGSPMPSLIIIFIYV
jgi:hypothetical protein